MRRRKKLSYLQSGSYALTFLAGGVSVALYQGIERPFTLIQAQNAVLIEPCFTPHQQCQKRLIEKIHQAQKSIYVMAYYLTALPIIEALIEAKKRSLDVQIIVDKSQLSKLSYLQLLLAADIPLFNDYRVAIAHNKVMIMDERTVITGSYNLTEAAETRNAENVLIIESPELAKLYQTNWEERRRVSQVLDVFSLL